MGETDPAKSRPAEPPEADPRHAATLPLADPSLGAAGSPLEACGGGQSIPANNPPLGRLGDYKLLAEIARGGMGVVYRARHCTLNRLVALKMILAGRLASQDEVRRFLVEAEAAARLDHPHIVPIYEIRSQGDEHYFAMKLVEGADFARRMPQLRQNPHAAVAILAKVADAVHHAHQRGILHRDLKPSNILLDDADEPHLADLGLAKPIDQRRDLTQTGAVMGTPGYMAPEQAASSKEATLAADVYSLGAILYELLTGQPPFLGDTPLATLVSVLNDAPRPPRELNPGVDRDLELVCLKCLSRDPGRRYASAGLLADELRAWLAGEPLSVRPPGMVTVMGNWVRHNVKAATLAVLVGLAGGALMGGLAWAAFMSIDVAGTSFPYELLPTAERPLLATTWVPTDWFVVAGVLGIVMVATYAGFANAVVVRPPSSSAAASAGTLAGLAAVAGILVFGGGWGPMLGLVVQPSLPDLYNVSQATWESDGSPGSYAAQRLLETYPDLARVPAERRTKLVADKTVADQMARIPGGLAAGILFSGVVGLVPSLVGTMHGAALLRKHGHRLHALAAYSETALPVTVSVLMFVGWVLAPLAGGRVFVHDRWVLAAIMTACLAAIAAGASRRRWPWRAAFQGAWICGFAALLATNQWRPDARKSADMYLAGGDLERAVWSLDQHLRLDPADGEARFHVAILRLYLGDKTGYRQQCGIMLDRFADTADLHLADITAKTCLVAPDPGGLFEPALRLARRVAESGQGDLREPWFQMLAGLASFRAGEPQEALSGLAACRDSQIAYVRATAAVLEAMALVHLGRHDEAKVLLAQADDMIARDANMTPPGPARIDALILEILRREAGRVVSNR